jgi:hypothetical protein
VEAVQLGARRWCSVWQWPAREVGRRMEKREWADMGRMAGWTGAGMLTGPREKEKEKANRGRATRG